MNVLDLFRLDGKVAIITGGGRGLGEQIAQAYTEAGAKVVLCSRRVENCEKVVEELKAQGADAYALALDVTDPASIEEAVAKSIEHYGRVDILVNNSGTSWGAPALEMPYDAWMKVIQTNLTGTFLMSQAVAKHMKEQGGGKIVNIASVAGLRGSFPEALDAVGYSASKGGVISLTKDLAVKWARYNIYVNAIAPGFFPTKMTKEVLAKGGDAITMFTPLRRVGGERDLQGAALYFASDASNFVTGQILAVDGGTVAR
ncbi:SDR family oxidoreductase [Alicyclobacillus cycloheptanicus]|jgi:gluconate 5-dehydrogenase|uniref:Gluconate 5-dehydrogenase n=1 Tax=Alicyclobacillus cycloheptanicus TaxID=1457 RepID=A0ABT9XJ06_9BACL|nr:SDR family oxidoreductase [Alicyclobacillus cycloheptanicus]MDQ0190287.1 gluconate 5-dehydrogenase [Alicyclobacillus cycloheptanicus]